MQSQENLFHSQAGYEEAGTGCHEGIRQLAAQQ